MTDSIAILWFRRDLRLSDNPALSAALKRHAHIIPVFIWDTYANAHTKSTHESIASPYPAPGAASRVWLHHSLNALASQIASLGSRLIIRQGKPAEILKSLIQLSGAQAIYWNELYEPDFARRDADLRSTLEKQGISCHTFNANYLRKPSEGCKADGTPYKVFTAYARAFQKEYSPADPIPTLKSLSPVRDDLPSTPLHDLALLPTRPWASSMMEHWEAGEAGAETAWKSFVAQGLPTYEETRNLPAHDHGVSRMSPHLHFGEISPRQLWQSIAKAKSDAPGKATRDNIATYANEIIWREFACHLLHHFPQMPETPLHQEFENMPWWGTEKDLTAWQHGNTGFPIVDAGMRQLWATGWMHNRVRMIVGSFLVKDLGLPWQAGEAWFWDTLIDADLAQNAMNWQWVAGCGVDASPWFRIFNPVSQGKKFDPEGEYVKTWVPEIASVPTKWIHEPWQAPSEHRPKNYPDPIVDHAVARTHALSAYKKLKEG